MTTYLAQLDAEYATRKTTDKCVMGIAVLRYGALLRPHMRNIEAWVIGQGGDFTYRDKHRGLLSDTLYNVEITGDYTLLSGVAITLDEWIAQ